MNLPGNSPFVLSTWSFGTVGNAAAWPVLAAGGGSLDAVVAGASAVEADPSVDSVGLGGLPDAQGRVSLDACVMENPDRCGAVCYLRRYLSAAQIARRVMERTIHVMLAGDGAEAFAESEGFQRDSTDLLTPASRAAWERWRAENATNQSTAGRRGFLPPMNVEERYRRDGAPRPHASHDTVCLLAMDAAGRLAGACTTSGLGFKIPGRVGDSPIIGHGLYVDQEAGAATATGNGELIMGVCGSFLAVELMRQGREPLEALMETLRRIDRRCRPEPQQQAAMLAIRADGAWASAALRPGFMHCRRDGLGEHNTPPLAVLHKS